jgi:NADPH-dependent 2,4-dienoyl-CoA reductase/sulfur reductase-like enzyme
VEFRGRFDPHVPDAERTWNQHEKENTMALRKYDLVVLGSGPAGEKAALMARKLGHTVALVEPQFIGGLCTHTGTLPTKASVRLCCN